MIEVSQTAPIPPKANGLAEERVKTPCDALPPGWTREIVARRSGLSAGKSDVYYYSPAGKKVRSKPELAQLLFQTSGKVIDLSNFDYRSGTFVVRASPKKSSRKRKQPSGVDVYSKDLIGVSMAFPSVPERQSKMVSVEPVTVVSKDNSDGNGKDMPKQGTRGRSRHSEEEIVSPRQIFWERRLQNMNGTKNSLEDIDIFSDKNGEFRSLLHSIVKTLQMERDMANKRTPLGTVACSSTNHEHPSGHSKTLIKITKEDILRQERQVVKARKELAKAITEYEAVKSL